MQNLIPVAYVRLLIILVNVKMKQKHKGQIEFEREHLFFKMFYISGFADNQLLIRPMLES